MSRVLAYGFGFGLVALVASKGFGDPDDDSYPLSTFPMFARARERPRLHFMEAVDTSGKVERLTPELVASGEVMQAAASVRRAVAAGPEAMAALCQVVAERVAKYVASGAELANVEVRIVSAVFEPVRYFSENGAAEERSVLFACPVLRAP